MKNKNEIKHEVEIKKSLAHLNEQVPVNKIIGSFEWYMYVQLMYVQVT